MSSENADPSAIITGTGMSVPKRVLTNQELEKLVAQPEQEKAVQAQRVHAAVDQLPDAQRQVIELHWFQGIPMREVADALGASHSAVKVRAHRAYKALRGLLGGSEVTDRASSTNREDR